MVLNIVKKMSYHLRRSNIQVIWILEKNICYVKCDNINDAKIIVDVYGHFSFLYNYYVSIYKCSPG